MARGTKGREGHTHTGIRECAWSDRCIQQGTSDSPFCYHHRKLAAGYHGGHWPSEDMPSEEARRLIAGLWGDDD